MAPASTLGALRLPESAANTRFFTDTFPIRRPALTFCGFDAPGPPRHGYGLAQVLRRAHEGDAQKRRLLHLLAETALLPLRQWKRADRSVVDHNSHVAQAAACVALVGLVLDQNDLGASDLGLDPARWPGHADALGRLRRLFRPARRGGTGTPLFPLFADEVFPGTAFDRVKWTKALTNTTRALDDYLALENAYAFYDLGDDGLLTRDEKDDLLRRYHRATAAASAVVDDVVGIGTSISGNWSLKMWVGAAYASLGAQHRTLGEQLRYQRWFERGRERAGPGDPDDRRQYWSFMTGRDGKDGQRFWGEGPYYLNFALHDVLPFWHAARATGQLGGIPDPHHSDWLLNPLEWMADVATPEGSTPPFDDGNRHPLTDAHVMQWAPPYGAARVGTKMAWIFQRITEVENEKPATWGAANPQLFPLQLALPVASTLEESPLPRIVGNRRPEMLDEEQAIVRCRLGGQTHYVCLHGEGGRDPIERGEGHEQPDQLQLLYYVDDRSLLMDAGYDRGHLLRNSRWNRYADHNVMAYVDGDGGMPAPTSSPVLVGGMLRKHATHQPVEQLYVDPHPGGRLFLLRGRVGLRFDRWLGGDQWERHASHYARSVLFVADEEQPYLIDVNQVWRADDAMLPADYRMRYHVDSGTAHKGTHAQPWDRWARPDGADLHLFAAGIEYEKALSDAQFEPFEVEERFRTRRTIQRYSLYSRPTTAFATLAVFTSPGDTPPAPVPLLPYHDVHARVFQAWTWHHPAAGAVDVLLARSRGNAAANEQSVFVNVAPAVAAGEVADLRAAESTALRLPPGHDVGFVRFARSDGVWRAVPEFQHGVHVQGEPPAVIV